MQKICRVLQKIRSYCRKYAENLQHCRKSVDIAENMQKICRYCQKLAENLQVLQKICRKSAENLQHCRKFAENLQVLQKICRKSAENIQVLQKICKKSADFLHIFWNAADFLLYLQIFCNYYFVNYYFVNYFVNYYSNSDASFNLEYLQLCGDICPNPVPASPLFDALHVVRDNGKQGVSIGHSNVRGLRKNLHEVKILLQHTNLDILTISETHLTQDIHDNEVNIDGY